MDATARHSFARRLLDAYPADLRRTGIGGSILLVALVDAQGQVRETRIARSSGYRTMDDAAAEVLRRARFKAATAGDCRIPYLLRLPMAYTP
jgi:protein TonB